MVGGARAGPQPRALSLPRPRVRRGDDGRLVQQHRLRRRLRRDGQRQRPHAFQRGAEGLARVARLRRVAAHHRASSRAAPTRSTRSRRPARGPKALRIKTAVGDWLYVEYRRPIGFDGYLSSNANVMSGVLVHYFDGDLNGVYLLDMTPATSSWSDPALAVGATFKDAAGQVSITPTGMTERTRPSTSPCGGTACVRRPPTVTITPGAATGRAGSDGHVHRLRRQQRHRAAAPSTFALQASVPPRAGRRRWARRPSCSPRARRGPRRSR